MPHTTALRELYIVLKPPALPTAGQFAVCEFLLNEHHRNPARPVKRLAKLFDDALWSKANTTFDASSHPFVTDGRPNPDVGTNATYAAINKLPGRVIRAVGVHPYEFRYLHREVQILRPENRASRHPAGSAWVDCMGISSENRPVLCEIKYQSDQNAFSALIQLLTYLSEVATAHQQARTREHLFKAFPVCSTAHDLVIFLVNPTLGGLKGELLERTQKLAQGFAKQIRSHHPRSAAVLGNIVCLQGTLDEATAEFTRPIETLWYVEG